MLKVKSILIILFKAVYFGADNKQCSVWKFDNQVWASK